MDPGGTVPYQDYTDADAADAAVNADATVNVDPADEWMLLSMQILVARIPVAHIQVACITVTRILVAATVDADATVADPVDADAAAADDADPADAEDTAVAVNAGPADERMWMWILLLPKSVFCYLLFC